MFTLEPEAPQQETPAPSSPRDADQFVDQFMYLLTAPYMFYPLGGASVWEANENKTTAQVHRLAQLQQIFAAKKCTEFEAMLYISTATLAHPPSHDWFCIYAWLFRRLRPEQGADIFDDHEGEKLSVNQQEDLARLRQWIFRQQLAHLKAKRMAAEKDTEQASSYGADQAPEVVEQPEMF